MDKNYIKFIIAYDYADKLEELELACDEAYELAEKIADEYDEYTRENNIEQYYETLQEFCIDWFQNYSKQNTEFTKEEFCNDTDVMNDVDRFFNKLFDAFCITFQ